MSDTMITLNNGVLLPTIGLGVLQSEGAEASAAVATALQGGYRLIDTAAGYFNEREVGRGIRESGVSREEIFLTTKLWMTDYGTDETVRAFETSIAKLGVDYLDLYLLHWPWPADWARTVAAYRALEGLLADGRVRAIGVANFSPEHLRALTKDTDVVPAVNQVELHPNFQQPAQVAAHAELGIATQAWSPIGGVYGWAGENGAVPPLQNETIRAIADAPAELPPRSSSVGTSRTDAARSRNPSRPSGSQRTSRSTTSVWPARRWPPLTVWTPAAEGRSTPMM